MAELILTDEEKASNSYLDWDDAALGKLTKKVALTIRDGRADDKLPIIANAAAMMLVGMAHDSNAETFTLTLGGCTHHGEPVGDWKVTVKRKST
jgi:hypothetical protein